MKYKILVICITILMFSCQEAIKNTESLKSEEPSSDSIPEKEKVVILEPRFISQNLTVLDQTDLYGFWVGDFMPDSLEREPIYTGEHRAWNYVNKISISIDSIAGETVIGHSIVAGNVRPFKGTILFKENQYIFDVQEPGDDKYDGHFTFSIGKQEAFLQGKWKAFQEIETSHRVFKLEKKLFKYQADAELEDSYVDWNKYKKYKMPEDISEEEKEFFNEKSFFSTTESIYTLNPSRKILNKKELEELTKADIFILRNSIYAKHGYSFKKRTLRAYFDRQSWYMPVHTDIKKELTEIEKKNIQALLRYEKNAEAYYDEFGRG